MITFAELLENPPFSFTYGGTPSVTLLATWPKVISTSTLTNGSVQTAITWTDQTTGLQVRWIGNQYPGFTTCDWVVYFANTGSATSSTLANVLAMNMTVGSLPSGFWTVHTGSGSNATVSDFAPLDLDLQPSTFRLFTTNGGRPTDGNHDANGDWRYVAGPGATGYFNEDQHLTSTAGSYASFTFTGTSVSWIGPRNVDCGISMIYLDGRLIDTIDQYASGWLKRQVLYASGILANTVHTIKVVCTDTKNAAATGNYCSVDAFQYISSDGPSTVNDADPRITFVSKSISSTNIVNGWPYFNLDFEGSGLICALGWPGQWGFETKRINRSTLNLQGAMTLADNAGSDTEIESLGLTNLWLAPGESIRTPLVVLQPWTASDWISAQNLWRQWMVRYRMPHVGVGTARTLCPTQANDYFSGQADAASDELIWMNAYGANSATAATGGVHDHWWIDAGWYSTPSDWTTVGTWTPDPQRFPNGLKPVTDRARALGMAAIVWFEPERVMPNTDIANQYPSWLLSPPTDDQQWGGVAKLFNFGNPDALAWAIGFFSNIITKQGIDFYREDFNIAPLGFWRKADKVDRQGLTQALYVKGHLDFWAGLKEAHPDVPIDTCASGGRRLDVESLGYAVNLLRSDRVLDATSNQSHVWGISPWVPVSGGGVRLIGGSDDIYNARAAMGASYHLALQATSDRPPWDQLKAMASEWRSVSGHYLEDFYRLTHHSTSDDRWLAWQFGTSASGFVQAFRRPLNTVASQSLPLFGLESGRTYELHDHLSGRIWRRSGRSLTTSGVAITMDSAPQATTITYNASLIDPWPVQPLEGYLSEDSVAPLEALTVHVRSDVGPFRLHILQRGISDSEVANLGEFPDAVMDIPVDAAENGCQWPAAARWVIPREWSSGLYIFRISSLSGSDTVEVPFVVKSGPGPRRTRILLAIASTTYEAYNWWGGRSFYGHGISDGSFEWGSGAAFRLSTQRPYLSATDFNKPKFQYWELPLIRWLERNGIEVDLCTSYDLHVSPDLLGQYELLVCVGHDEYWSWEMRDNVEQFIAFGGKAAILSGNSVWWQIRFDGHDSITCYKSASADPANNDPATRSKVTVNWTAPPVSRSEALLTGVSYKYSENLLYGDGVTEAPVFEVISKHPLIANTNLAVGETFGTYTQPIGARPSWRGGLYTIVGYECDARPVPDDELDWRANWDQIIPIDLGVASTTEVLFYDMAVGEGEVLRVAKSGTLSPLIRHAGWRRSWDKIVPGYFGQTTSPDFLFYDRNAGHCEFYATDSRKRLSLLCEYSGWRQSWSQIVPGNFAGNGYTDLLFYDSEAGQGEFYASYGSGRIVLLRAHDGWRRSWSHIVPGDFGGDGHTDLLFYDRQAGQAEFYSTDGNGNITFLNGHGGWRSSWDRIIALQFADVASSVLLFYDRTAGVGEFYTTDGRGNVQLLVSHVNWRRSWRHIVPLKLDNSDLRYLFFYEEGTGYAELYAVTSLGQLLFIHPYKNPTFSVIAKAMFQPPRPMGTLSTPLKEYATLGVLSIGAGQVFTASTTDWSFGLSQSPTRWSAVDQITANVLHLFGSAPEIVRPITA